ncbi:MAG: DEAD/DEAH box helicase, partial [Leptolyngbya sp. SIO4C1]|nr:DEAD/DEAH box helicase [Leptolyngbya sp. SIO4C1]
MYILHGTWIPDDEKGFIRAGGFYLWVETPKRRALKSPQRHPYQLSGKAFKAFMAETLGLEPSLRNQSLIQSRYFLLPSDRQGPLPSLELSGYLEAKTPAEFELRYWEISCCRVETILTTSPHGRVTQIVVWLQTLYEQVSNGQADYQLGADLLFWYHYTQALRTVVLNDHYIPALKYRDRSQSSSSQSAGSQSTGSQSAGASFEIYSGWQIVGRTYEEMVVEYQAAMPLACCTGAASLPAEPTIYERETLLRHFSDCWLTGLLTRTFLPQVFMNRISGSMLEDCLSASGWRYPRQTAAKLERYRQWQTWRDRICRTQTNSSFYLGFQLKAPAKPEKPWVIAFQASLKSDPSMRLTLLDYWRMEPGARWAVRVLFGEDFEAQLLLNLGQAARIYPPFWQGLETDSPVGITLSLEAALEFLQETAWVLESAGYQITVPSWWTAQGRRRLKLRLQARTKSDFEEKSKAYFSLDNLVEYEYQLAIGDEDITPQEWQQLVNAKTPLVQFRGQWVMLDQSKMQEMLSFFQQQPSSPETSLLGLMRLSAEQPEFVEFECDRDDALAEMLDQLSGRQQIQVADDPAQLQGSLRNYQKRGLAWVQFLEQLGINGCLADDMGLGKTIQVIARLVQEREASQEQIPPTLLIAPTSVIGNWYHELHQFAPHLRAAIHHGPQRAKTTADLEQAIQQHDVVITSFSLARRDSKLLYEFPWHRVVLDEAQNIKNPQAAQTKAIAQLTAQHKLALTGTPIENRLMDLWSIFNFLNPGYLGAQKQFRDQFESPIQ